MPHPSSTDLVDIINDVDDDVDGDMDDDVKDDYVDDDDDIDETSPAWSSGSALRLGGLGFEAGSDQDFNLYLLLSRNATIRYGSRVRGGFFSASQCSSTRVRGGLVGWAPLRQHKTPR